MNSYINYIFYIIFFCVSLLSGCSEGDLSELEEQLLVAKLDIKAIRVEATAPIMPLNETQQLKAVGIKFDSTETDITSGMGVVWSTSNGTVASVDNKGLLSSTAIAGDITVSAALSNVSVTPASIKVSDNSITSIQIKDLDGNIAGQPNNLSTSTCSSKQLLAIANYNNEFEWDITNKSATIWKIENSIGEFNVSSKGLLIVRDPAPVSPAPFESSISVTNTVTASTLVPVLDNLTSINIVFGTSSVPVSNFTSLSATAIRSDTNLSGDDITTIASWSSAPATGSTGTVLIEEEKGTLKGVTAGTVTVTADCAGAPIPATNNIEVTSSKKLERVEIEIDNIDGFYLLNVGDIQPLTARAYFSDGTDKAITTETETTWTLRYIQSEVKNPRPITIENLNNNVRATANTIGFSEIVVEYNDGGIKLKDDVVVRVQ